ncbi:MAG: preprotein translocase subunit SecG [Caulobacter sp.]|nr:preprotein translocase subunit SecG [Caulobacter sp.]
MLLNILLTIQIIVAVLLGVAVLLQRSEGGALGMGGGPSGFMTARGQGDLLTRSTWILFAIFLLLCVGLTIVQGRERAGSSVANRGGVIERSAPLTPPATTPAAPTGSAPAPQLRGLPAPTSTAPGSAVDGALGGVAPIETPPSK